MNGTFLIQQLAYSGPVIIIYLVGLGLAVTFIKKYPVNDSLRCYDDHFAGQYFWNHFCATISYPLAPGIGRVDE